MSLDAFQVDLRALCDAHYDRQVEANEAWVDGINRLFADHEPTAENEDPAEAFAGAMSAEIKRLHDRLKAFEKRPLEREPQRRI